MLPVFVSSNLTLQHHCTQTLLLLQKMAGVLEKLWAYVSSIPIQLSAEVRERESFKEQLQAIFSAKPISFSHLNSVMSCELERRSAVVHSQKRYLQVTSNILPHHALEVVVSTFI